MRQPIYEPLVMAVLSVNNYSLEKAWQIRTALEKAGLFDLEILASLPRQHIVQRLREAGYNRGEFLTDLVASRLHSVGAFLVDYGVENATRVLASGPVEEVRAMLIKINGVGPVVIRSFLTLRGDPPRAAGPS